MEELELDQGLAWWGGAGQDFMLALGLVASHPGLHLAVRALARNMLALADGDAAIATVFKDAGRYVGAMLAFQLHQTGHLTLARFKAACRDSRMLSPGRARAVLQVFEHLGYAVGRPGPAAAYDMTPAFEAAWDAHLRAALEAGRTLEPELGRLLDAPDPAPVRSYGLTHAEGMAALAATQMGPVRFVEVFMHPHAAVGIIWALLDSAPHSFPPERAGPVSVSGLARRFGVSRIHVSRIFEAAAREGLAELGPDGMVTFSALAREQLVWLYAAQLAQILAAAGRAARAHGLAGAPVPA